MYVYMCVCIYIYTDAFPVIYLVNKTGSYIHPTAEVCKRTKHVHVCFTSETPNLKSDIKYKT